MLLVMERMKVAPPKAMEMRIKVKYTSVYHTELLLKAHLLRVNTLLFILAVFPKSSPLLSWTKFASLVVPYQQVEKFLRRQSLGVELVDLKPKRFDEVYNVHTTKEMTETSTSAEAPDRTNCG